MTHMTAGTTFLWLLRARKIPRIPPVHPGKVKTKVKLWMEKQGFYAQSTPKILSDWRHEGQDMYHSVILTYVACP